ncbi:uncharacterized protein LOC123409264 isoform X1 [Hordeum vulgare subsp. vulgare]|uniref:uncharacterized protein LOC123409264 isoform X1 n=1 Tax=Hordeum vulgare subsp. vulgare TaxID=112509 RepID=UPI001D1A520E|nr:uncharacterized protein LOC123409264 isoform X1 [Hordeum vulgare subsp. vulgare]
MRDERSKAKGRCFHRVDSGDASKRCTDSLVGLTFSLEAFSGASIEAIAMDLFSGEVCWRDTGEWLAGGNVFATIFAIFLCKEMYP